jgi:hypothetical protein
VNSKILANKREKGYAIDKLVLPWWCIAVKIGKICIHKTRRMALEWEYGGGKSECGKEQEVIKVYHLPF